MRPIDFFGSLFLAAAFGVAVGLAAEVLVSDWRTTVAMAGGAFTGLYSILAAIFMAARHIERAVDRIEMALDRWRTMR